MASANIYSLENPPPIEYIFNNQGGHDIKCLNYVFNRKTFGRRTANYVCTSCYASISLKTVVKKVMDKDEIQIVEPFVITHLNLNHKANCLPKSEQQLEVKERVENNPLLTTNQIYESERNLAKVNSATVFPDYNRIKDRFVRTRRKNKRPNPQSMAEVIVHDTMTTNGKFKFLIHDNHKRNRILVFASPTGLRMLSECEKWHADGTFHTKSKYFGQLYTIHAFYPSKDYDKANPDKVWVKRMIPAVWAFMKKRRTKDYVRLLQSLSSSALELGFIL